MFSLFNNKGKTHDKVYCSAIIVGAGESSRMTHKKNKPLIEVLNKPVIAYSIECFENLDLINNIIIVSKEEDIIDYSSIVEQYGFSKVSKIVVGGEERYNSVYNGLKELDEKTDIVLIHDGARPLISIDIIEDAICECIKEKAVVVGVKVKDTIKVVNEDGFIIDTPKRSSLWIEQTPQVFDYNLIVNAYEKAFEDGFIGLDDASIVERLGNKVKMIEGEYQNIKITTDEDLLIVEAFLQDGFMQ